MKNKIACAENKIEMLLSFYEEELGNLQKHFKLITEMDADVLEAIKEEKILAGISDDKMVKRLILNCFCEFLSTTKQLHAALDEMSQMINICAGDKLASFFRDVRGNFEKEKTRVQVQEKISQSHKQPKNRKKIVKNS